MVGLIVGVLWDIHFLSKPSLNFGGDAGNLLGSRRVNLVDVLLHPYYLPRLEFESVEGHFVVVGPEWFLSGYPDQVCAFFEQFDPVRRTTGSPYQDGTAYLVFVAVALPVASRILSSAGATPGAWSSREAGCDSLPSQLRGAPN